MPTPVEVIEAEALRLSRADRSRLVGRLIASLDKDPKWESAWSEEADKREERITQSETSWNPGSEAMARIREALEALQ